MRIDKKLVLVFLIIFISFSPLLSNMYKAFALLGLTVIVFFNFSNKSNKNFMALFIIEIILLSNATLDLFKIEEIGEYSILNMYFPLCILFGYIVSNKFNINNYLIYIHRIVLIIALFSLVGVTVYTYLPQIVFALPEYVYMHTRHRTAFIFNVLTIGRYVIQRNAGIAWEPGAFQLLLNVGLYSYIKFCKGKNLFVIIVYLLAIVSTRSTTGLIIFAINYMILLIENRESRAIRWFSLLVIVVFANEIRELIEYNLSYKINFEAVGFNFRFSPMIQAYISGKSNLFGLGNSQYKLLYEDLGIGSFDSFSQIFVRYGYFLTLMIIIRLFKLIKRYFPLFVIIAFTFISQTIWFFPFITPFYFFTLDREEGKDEDIMVNKRSTTRSIGTLKI